MNGRRRRSGALVLLILGAGLVWQFSLSDEWAPKSRQEVFATGSGDVKTVQAKYDRWRAQYTRAGNDRALVLPLRYSKGLSSEVTKAYGDMTLNLFTGSTSTRVYGLPEAEGYDVWLVDNRPGPGHSVKPEPGDGMIHLGSLQLTESVAKLETSLSQETLAGFRLDLVVVARKGEGPGKAGLLFGSLGLFERLYYNEQQGQGTWGVNVEAPTSSDASQESILSAPFRALVPAPAYAKPPDGPPGLQSLVSQGESLFMNETFEGNGRTCATCHRADNNFTIDPPFMATLPPEDKLFVAEHGIGLAALEQPALMRQFGVILENVDTFPVEGVMRGVPHTLALDTSLVTNLPGILEATGWSGDGAPNLDLLSFATGAVVQHFTRCLPRPDPPVSGPCFRLPTMAELVAMKAFQLSLGRSRDPNLALLKLTGFLPKQGQGLFTDDSKARCNVCHLNAGANFKFSFPPKNRNFDTGVERMPANPVRLLANELGLKVPCDGGLGAVLPAPAVVGGPCEGLGDDGVGDGTFNVPPLVEAADTAPFFHNNSIQTIEGAVEFYNSAAFNTSPAGLAFPIALERGRQHRA